MEDRLIEIEIKVAYQEHTINELNDVIYQQQKQIDQLERLCKSLADRLENLTESPYSDKGGHERPPHY